MLAILFIAKAPFYFSVKRRQPSCQFQQLRQRERYGGPQQGGAKRQAEDHLPEPEANVAGDAPHPRLLKERQQRVKDR